MCVRSAPVAAPGCSLHAPRTKGDKTFLPCPEPLRFCFDALGKEQWCQLKCAVHRFMVSMLHLLLHLGAVYLHPVPFIFVLRRRDQKRTMYRRIYRAVRSAPVAEPGCSLHAPRTTAFLLWRAPWGKNSYVTWNVVYTGAWYPYCLHLDTYIAPTAAPWCIVSAPKTHFVRRFFTSKKRTLYFRSTLFKLDILIWPFFLEPYT